MKKFITMTLAVGCYVALGNLLAVLAGIKLTHFLMIAILVNQVRLTMEVDDLKKLI